MKIVSNDYLVDMAINLHKEKKFSKEDLIELLAIEPPKNDQDVVRYETDVFHYFLKGKINYNKTLMNRASNVIQNETRLPVKEKMISKVLEWEQEVAQWKSFIA